MRFSEGLHDWFALAWEKKVLRLAALLCACGFVAILALSGFASAFMVLPLVLFAVLSVAAPDSEAPLITVVGGALFWGFLKRTPDLHSPLTLLAALLLFAFHCLLSVTAHGPGRARLDPRNLRRWGLRGLSVAAATAVAWLALMSLSSSPLHAPAWGRGAALLLVGLGVLAAIRLVGDGGRED